MENERKEVMSMNELWKDMTKSPFSTIVVVGAITTGIVKIINAVKGTKVEPTGLRITIHKPEEN
jgi:hypothetical protein